MNEAEAREAVRPLGQGVKAEPLGSEAKVVTLRDVAPATPGSSPGAPSELPELTTRQIAWLELKAEQGWPQVGPCRWLPGGCLVVEIQGMFGKTTHIIDPEGMEL